MATFDTQVGSRLAISEAFSNSNPNVDLVLIPGVGTAAVREWGVCQQSWLSMLEREEHSRLRILEFHYQIPLDDHFSWQFFLDQGANLLRELSQLRSATDAQKRPLLLMCHSLGGFILKQAISIANFQHPRYDLLLNALVGMVFLGTPHSSPGDDTLWEQCLWILRAANPGMSNKQALLQKKNDTSLLTNLGARFQDVNTNLRILSVYEERKTIIPRTFTSKKLILVDLELAKIGALREQCFGLPLSHLDLCSLKDENGEPDMHIVDWMRTVLRYSISNVEDRMRSYRSRTPSDHRSDSGGSKEAAEYVLSRNEGSAEAGNTGEGQYGSTTIDLEVIPMVEAFAPSRRQAVLPCRSLGGYPRNKEFTGRVRELELLDSLLLPSQDRLVSSESQASRHVTLCGMAGLGKTELALEFAHSRQERFDAVFWIHADTVNKLERDFADIAVNLGLEDDKEPRDLVVNRETAKGWLSKPTKLLDQTHDTVGQTEASWLIVLDNADNPDVISEYTHIFGSGSWLITSRHPLAKTSFSRDTTVLDLEPLDNHTGAQLLQRLTGANDDDHLSLMVSQRLGGLPLAIAQMAGVIRRQYMLLKDFLEVYEDDTRNPMDSPTGSLKSLNVLELELEQRPARARGSIASIWAIDALTPSSRSLLEAMIFLDPDCIQDYLMKDCCAQVITDASFPRRLKGFFTARAALMNSSLLKTVNDDTGVRIHRVLQDAVRVNSRRKLDVIFADTVAVLCEAWPSAAMHKIHDVERWPRCKEIYQHVNYLRAEYKEQLLEGKNLSKFQYAKLLYEAGWYQHATGNSYAIRDMLDESWKICQTCEESQQSRNLLADIHYTMGAIASETNDPELCMQHTRALLDMRMQVAEKTAIRDVRLAIAYNENGIARMMSRDFDGAERCFESAIDVYSSLPDFRKDMNTVSHANRGLAAWLKGDFTRAIKIFEDAIRDREELFGFLDKENFRCGRLWYGLGNVRWSLGEFKQSWECHQNAFEQAQDTVGVRHHRFADICHRIAQHLLRHSNLNRENRASSKTHLEQAREVIDQALGIWGTHQATYRPELARSSFLKAKILHRAGAVDDASALFKYAAKSWRELSAGANKPDRDLTEEDFDELVTFWSK
ncbi:hypothetical protein Z517_12419 [Fonsecaea pedrosoi CBS 271.37]|uniref:Unplaced genomic scaffold supercont1.9, whole genome shotgun sequence n=1 Tax=Fonsecaea pedrosoi CBS 271.37 TaxID=1442368 RepID=A0A0D2GQ17_9EURO|nr:uncharacterized protein Z517_12419 [Fonsecaea pedrosoi CBS 271.37]KIW74479.1 hypothetical protein Z517_12419 [Fonsecaea pedrosoi CBS 271.37]